MERSLDRRYRVIRCLGNGGMSEVYEAVDRRTGDHVALKVLHSGVDGDARRSEVEAQVLAALDHPAIVRLHATGTYDGRPGLVLDLVRGATLATRLAAGPLPVGEAARIGALLADGLAHAHAHHVVHRDLAPSNVLLSGDGEVRLTDFGIARLLDAATAHTRTGEVLGTAAYLAPEQVEGRQVTPAADVYSLGLVLLEALTGERAFPGAPTESAMARLVRRPPIPDDLAPDLQALLRSMTEWSPEARPAAPDVAATLRRHAAPAPATTAAPEHDRTDRLPRRAIRTHRTWVPVRTAWVMATVVVLVALATAATFARAHGLVGPAAGVPEAAARAEPPPVHPPPPGDEVAAPPEATGHAGAPAPRVASGQDEPDHPSGPAVETAASPHVEARERGGERAAGLVRVSAVRELDRGSPPDHARAGERERPAGPPGPAVEHRGAQRSADRGSGRDGGPDRGASRDGGPAQNRPEGTPAAHRSGAIAGESASATDRSE